MSIRSARDLGAIEAQKDDNFEQHFIEIHQLNKIIDDDSDIIYGLKGSGKTALCRALTEINSSKFLDTKLINLDSISFSQIHDALERLQSTTHKEIVKLASKTWHNVLLIYGIEVCSQVLPNSDPLKEEITSFINRKKYASTKSNNRIISYINNFLINLKRIAIEEVEETPLGLTQTQLDEIDKTFDDEILSLLNKCKSRKIFTDKKILLCLDGFDSIIDHTPESRKAIFSGLVDTIYKLSKDPIVCKAFCFKAFLPRELTDEIRNVHFDADKFLLNTHFLYWNTPEFEQLINRRLSKYSKSKSNNFKDIWSEHMPEEVYNSAHNTKEKTFQYILRHTLHRPRHFLLQLQYIFDEWDSKYSATRIDPSFIPGIVAKTNTSLSALICSELEFIAPGITQFMHSWNATSCTMNFKDFRTKMNRMFGIQNIQDERKLFDNLFNMGIFGYYKHKDINSKQKNTIKFDFSYSGINNQSRLLYNTLDDSDILALSPVFSEFCGCEISEFGIICQK